MSGEFHAMSGGILAAGVHPAGVRAPLYPSAAAPSVGMREFLAWEPAQVVGARRASVSSDQLLRLVEQWEEYARDLDHEQPENAEDAEDCGSAAAYGECATRIRELLFGAG